MNEIFPVSAGILVGLVCSRIPSIRARIIIITLLSILFGYLATVISGESKISWAFLYADMPLVAGSAVGALLAVQWYRKVFRRAGHTAPPEVR